MEKRVYYSKLLAGIAFCLCFIVYGTLIFIKSEQIDFETCLYLFKTVVPYSFVIACLGYYIGRIVDNAGKKKKREIR